MKRVVVGFLVIILSLLIKSCDTTDPPDNKSLLLKLEDVSCTEAWIKLTTTNLQLPTTITLEQNNQTRSTINLDKSDTLLYIDSLLPNQTYSFVASHSGLSGISSNELSVTTLDTTSHEFTFQTWTFGEHSSSVLYDVAIISENNIWAVGEIYMNDSLGQPDPTFYNAAHWNGQNWELKRIFYGGGIWTIRTIFSFNANDIWFSAFVKYDGQNFTELPIPPILMGWTINKIWGSSSSNLYAVGNNGNIAWYNGSQWTKIESGTDVNLTDIYGTPDGDEVWTCGWNNTDGHTVLIRIVNVQSEIIFDSFNPNNLPYNSFISSLWTNGKLYFWLTGVSDGAVKHSFLNRSFTKKESFGLQYAPYRIRGTDLNNISLVGSAAMLWHYNGYSWKWYEELLNLDDRLRSMDMKGNFIVAVGYRYESLQPPAVIIMGRQQ